ncbi:hypothetical protein SAMD00019534_105320 [Acytostelium subglobosum LB1]|uniref:hypothetical protein n=1 Tax=Acytostelium subglobosum LB1 TaxID=1410327 RepID=UPI000644DE37|nr:hypothetical protein SAMD00019534_105320 [Acytostelium subglobosum LB1]GAM27357.1 hypothetical protein SAMD00019534_105320 [Acytostelium subglobosum LB1]|eukprot:XP_012749824.1 hypothetical protein SAMD00019534_105320 [Acytostelium subglobosum LB1]
MSVVHPFSAGNTDERYSTLKKVLDTMKLTFAQYRQLESEKEMSKLLVTQRQYSMTNSKLKQLNKTISDCALFGKIHLDNIANIQAQSSSSSSSSSINNNNNNNAGRKRLGLLASRLSELMAEVDNRFGSYSDLEELKSLSKLDPNDILPENVYSCNISSSTFILDIFVYGDGNIKEVKLVYINMANETETTSEYTNDLATALRNNAFKDFDQKLRRICMQDLLFRKYKHVNLQNAKQVLESDFMSIERMLAERYPCYGARLKVDHPTTEEISSPLYGASFGKIGQDSCGLRINYYMTMQQCLAQETGLSMTLEFEEGRRPFKLPLSSQLSGNPPQSDADITNQQYFNEFVGSVAVAPPIALNQTTEAMITDDSIISPVRFVARLDPPIHVTLDTMAKIIKCVQTIEYGEDSNEQAYPLSAAPGVKLNPMSMLENQIVQPRDKPRSPPQTLDKHYDNVVFGAKQRYFFTGGYHQGIELSRVPFEHCSQLLPVIQICRQQAVFNLLLRSCFTSQPTEDQTPGEESSASTSNTTITTPPTVTSSSTTPATTSSNTAPDQADEATSIPIFEVMCNPPYSINITFLHPKTMHFNFIEVQVDLGGAVAATIQSSQEDEAPLCSDQYLTRMLSASKSIPITLSFILGGNNINANNPNAMQLV